MFYDNACRREAFLQNRSDPGWSTTCLYVDRFHFRSHNLSFCRIHTNPEDRSDPIIWRQGPGQSREFRFNSSAAEGTNAWAEGLGHVLSSMPRVWNEFVFDMCAVVHN
ncbi:unnamed protein product, partial [Ascophyllum nodosum]